MEKVREDKLIGPAATDLASRQVADAHWQRDAALLRFDEAGTGGAPCFAAARALRPAADKFTLSSLF